MAKTVLISLIFAAVSGWAATPETFGGKVSLTEVQSLDTIIANHDQYEKKDVLVKGVVEKVCQKKGCWLTLKSGNQTLRTFFKDYGFEVPKDIAGRVVRLQGQVIKKMVSIREQRHLLRDEKAPKEEISKVQESKATYRFIASAVELF